MAAINNGGGSATTSSSTTDIVYVRKVVRKDLLSKDGCVFLNRNNEFIFATVSGITDTSYKFLVRDGDVDTEETVDIRFDSGEEIVVVYNAKVLPSGKEIDIVEVNINPEANLLATPVYAMTSVDSEIPQFEEVKSIKSTKDETVFLCKLSGKRKKSVKVSTVFIGVNVVDDSDDEDEDEEKEPTLEDGAKSGCKRCKNELETGKKTTAKHTPSCPRSKQSKTARESEKKKSQKKSSSNNKEDDYSDKSGVNSDDDDLSDAESEEVMNGDGKTRAQRAKNRNNSTGGNNLGRGNKNSRPRDKSPTSNSSRNRTTNPAAKRQRKQTGGGKRLSNNNSGGAATTAAPPVISISNGENTPRNNQNGSTSHAIGSGQGGGAGLVDSTLSGSISTSNSGSSTMDMPPNPNNMLFVEIGQGSVSDNGQQVRKCWVNMATGEVRTSRPSPGELQARLGPPTQVTVQPQQSGMSGVMQQQGQTNMMMPPQQFDMGEMMQMQMTMMMNQQQNQQQMLQQQQQQMLQQQQQQQPQVPGLMSLLGSIFSWVCS